VDEKLICHKCGLELLPRKTVFNYMGYNFKTDLPRCPSCGLLYIPEDLVTGKMASVEMELEEK
jgi:hypothetical protein